MNCKLLLRMHFSILDTKSVKLCVCTHTIAVRHNHVFIIVQKANYFPFLFFVQHVAASCKADSYQFISPFVLDDDTATYGAFLHRMVSIRMHVCLSGFALLYIAFSKVKKNRFHFYDADAKNESTILC